MLLAGCCLLLMACIRREVPTADRGLAVRVQQLEPFDVELPKNFAAYETFVREQWIDGSYSIEYTFEPPEGQGLPFLYSYAEIERTHAEACSDYNTSNLGFKIGGVTARERNEVFKYGDKSRFALLVDEGEPYGNLFNMCDGKTAFFVLVSGIYFEDAESWQQIVGPVLKVLESRR